LAFKTHQIEKLLFDEKKKQKEDRAYSKSHSSASSFASSKSMTFCLTENEEEFEETVRSRQKRETKEEKRSKSASNKKQRNREKSGSTEKAKKKKEQKAPKTIDDYFCAVEDQKKEEEFQKRETNLLIHNLSFSQEAFDSQCIPIGPILEPQPQNMPLESPTLNYHSFKDFSDEISKTIKDQLIRLLSTFITELVIFDYFFYLAL
jgi:flagellar biosynthesis GTPase FlhF